MDDIYQALWSHDENRFSVGLRDEQGSWTDPDADLLLDEQARASGRREIDLATRPLFHRVDEQRLERPTYAAFIALLDNYVANYRAAEEHTAVEEAEQQRLLDALLETTVADVALRHLNTLGANLSREGFRVLLRTLWFESYTNYFQGRSTNHCSGFEHVFVGEAKYDERFGANEHLGEISGYHSWVKFFLDESRSRVNFLGYKYDVQGATAANTPDVVTLQMIWNLTDMDGRVTARLFKKKGGFFVGPSPECELVMGAVAFWESRRGMLRNDRRRTTINGATYDLVLYRNITAQGNRGEFIRSFYPEFISVEAGPTDNPTIDRAEIVPVSPVQTGPVLLVRALPNPQGPDEGNEWVELRNDGAEVLSLDGWELRDRMGRPEALAGEIAPATTRRVVLSRTTSQSMQLGNKAGAISLHRGSELMALVTYARAAEGVIVEFL